MDGRQGCFQLPGCGLELAQGFGPVVDGRQRVQPGSRATHRIAQGSGLTTAHVVDSGCLQRCEAVLRSDHPIG